MTYDNAKADQLVQDLENAMTAVEDAWELCETFYMNTGERIGLEAQLDFRPLSGKLFGRILMGNLPVNDTNTGPNVMPMVEYKKFLLDAAAEMGPDYIASLVWAAHFMKRVV